jgi:hypothetical protein
MTRFKARSILVWPVALATIALAQGAHAATTDITVDVSLSSLPSNSDVQVLNLGAAATSGLVTSNELYFGQGNTIQFSGTAGVYHGTDSGVAAAPYTSSGPQKTNYIAAEPNGNVTISYTQKQAYFGLNWGSVDSYNTLTFYEGSTQVASYSGGAITSNDHGSQAADGSDIVNFDFNNGLTYNRVVMSSTTPAFEFDTIASSTTAVSFTGSSLGAPTVVSVYSDAAQTKLLAGEAPLPALGSSPLAMVMLAGAVFLTYRRQTPCPA